VSERVGSFCYHGDMLDAKGGVGTAVKLLQGLERVGVSLEH
jgi:hypothetical protein